VCIHKKHLREGVSNAKGFRIKVFVLETDNVLGVTLAPLARVYLLGFPSSPALILKNLKNVGSGEERVSAGYLSIFGLRSKSSRSVSA
jgi:hypothetical protein